MPQDPEGKSFRPFDIVAIGASAGGVEAIRQLLERLPGDLPASVLVVLHRSIERISSLQQVLACKSKLHVVVPHQGEPLRHGICYVGEPDKHLTIGPHSHLNLLPDHFYRTHNIDALFSSLARHAGSRTVGVILSGMLKDGSFGLKAIKEAGGMTLVQSPQEAAYREMPLSAIKYAGSIDLVAPIDGLAVEICRLTGCVGRS
jgi:two-component system, chemotaxis family, protein-glutamate methylesterase/glutaminase